MTLRTYIANLKVFAKEYPDALDLEVITSKDDEGNGFNTIKFTPTRGKFDGEDFLDFGDDSSLIKEHEINSVCVN
jgi:hypothetical protein